MTIRIKQALVKQGKAIAVETPLVRTGLLRKSFNYLVQNKKNAIVFNAQEYALIHHTSGITTINGKPATIPKRILADVDTARIEMVTKVFTNWMTKVVKQHKM